MYTTSVISDILDVREIDFNILIDMLDDNIYQSFFDKFNSEINS